MRWAHAPLRVGYPRGMSTPFGLPHRFGPHNNGDNIYGYYGPNASALAAAGTPIVSIIKRSSVTPEMRNVRVGERLRIAWAVKYWEVFRGGELVGRLTWRAKERTELPSWRETSGVIDADEAVLEVHHLFISSAGEVVNLGGVAYPVDHPALGELWQDHVNMD